MSLSRLLANIDLTQVREEQFNGRAYKVAPVVMAVGDGVMNEILYPSEELSKHVAGWNGRPVTLFHPKSPEGDFVSANSPNMMEQVQLGHLFNSAYAEGKLKAEVWVDVGKTTSSRPEILEYLNGTKQGLEVSTGLFGDFTPVTGTQNGKQYKGVMRNIVPDHLALLPGGEGACNWGDGCGLRANEIDSLKEDLSQMVYFNITDRELREAMRKAIDAMNSKSSNSVTTHYLEEIDLTKKQVIYEKSTRTIGANGEITSWDEKLFRRSYTMENGLVTLADDAVEVRRTVSYKEITSNEKEQYTMTKEEKVAALIACNRCKFTEKDRDFLMGLNEDQLDLVSPPDNVVVQEEKKPETGKTDLQNTVAEEFNKSIKANESQPQVTTLADWMTNQKDMPAEVKETLTEAIMENASMRAGLIGDILKNPNNSFSQEQLLAMNTTNLKAIAKLAASQSSQPDVPITPNFGMRVFGQAVETPKGNEQKEPEPLTVVNLAEVFKSRTGR